MSVKQKLSGDNFLAVLIIAGLIGVFVQSWAIFLIALIGLLAAT